MDNSLDNRQMTQHLDSIDLISKSKESKENFLIPEDTSYAPDDSVLNYTNNIVIQTPNQRKN